jgi:hypothetical protein
MSQNFFFNIARIYFEAATLDQVNRASTDYFVNFVLSQEFGDVTCVSNNLKSDLI